MILFTAKSAVDAKHLFYLIRKNERKQVLSYQENYTALAF